MESRRQLHVLPSSIPLDTDHILQTNGSAPKRALQETTGNVRNIALDNIALGQLKASSTSTISTVKQRPVESNAPSRDHRAALSTRLEQKKRRRNAGKDLQPIIAAEQSFEYQQYRARQPRDSSDRDSVWPDHLEEVFQKALVDIECMGRRKRPMGGKPCGRNELIAEYIFERTGERRTRKQVSSHIQVLKGKLKQCPTWMQRVTPKESSFDDPRVDANETLQRIAARFRSRNSGITHHGSQPPTHENSPMASVDAFGNQVAPDTQRLVRPLSFTLSIHPSDNDNSSQLSCHNYTTLDGLGQHRPVMLDDLSNWRQTFPRLSSLHRSGTMNCEITYLETSLDLSVPFPLAGCCLGIDFAVLASPVFAGHTWHYATHIYEGGALVRQANHALSLSETFEDGSAKFNPAFESNFWAQTFRDWDFMEQDWRTEMGAEQAADELEQRFVRKMSAVQELYASVPGVVGSSTQKLTAVFLWKFKRCQLGEMTGTTTWRNLIPPASRILNNPPAGQRLIPQNAAEPSVQGSGLWPNLVDNELSLYQGLDGGSGAQSSSLDTLRTTSPDETLPTESPAGFYPGFPGDLSQPHQDSMGISTGLDDVLDVHQLYGDARSGAVLLEGFDTANVGVGVDVDSQFLDAGVVLGDHTQPFAWMQWQDPHPSLQSQIEGDGAGGFLPPIPPPPPPGTPLSMDPHAHHGFVEDLGEGLGHGEGVEVGDDGMGLGF